jgi:hypothetical protein
MLTRSRLKPLRVSSAGSPPARSVPRVAFGSLAPMDFTVVPTDILGTRYQFTSHCGRS